MKRRTIDESFLVTARFCLEAERLHKESTLYIKAIKKELILLEKKVDKLQSDNIDKLSKNESLICRIGDLNSTIQHLRNDK